MKIKIIAILMVVVLSGLVTGCAEKKGNARIISERPGTEPTRIVFDEYEEDETTQEVTEEQTSKKETETTTKNNNKKKNVVTTDTVRVRKGPSTDSDIYKTLEAGVKLYRESDDGTWSTVIIQKKKYYIASEYLKEIKLKDDNEQATKEETTKKETNNDAKKSAVAKYLEKEGYTMDYLNSTGCKQLVVVEGSGSSASIHFFTKGNKWTEDKSLQCSGFVGSEGTISPYYMSESHSATPRGLYGIGQAFYIDNKPETGLGIFQITNETYWIDDPDSSNYNKRVEGTSNKDWNSAEHMIDYYDAYKYGFVIQYNTASEYNKGSAIFFHVSTKATAGCVGTSESMVLKYLEKLDQSMVPLIFVC